jgi:hypothetical protein
MYATLYFAIHELNLLTQFKIYLAFYRRYIDDCLGIWLHDPNPEIDAINWTSFKDTMQTYGSLEWELTERQRSTDFLGLTIEMKSNGTFRTKLFEKNLNLYLYIPPHSAHPPGVLRGLTTGMLKHIYRLTTDATDILPLFNIYCNIGGTTVKSS